MTVNSLKASDIVYIHQKTGKKFYFTNGQCEIPDAIAMEMVQGSPSYQIAPEQKDQTNFKVKFDPATWTERKRIIFDTPTGYNNGYGKAGMMLGKGLVKAGVNLRIINGHWAANSEHHIPEEITQNKIEEDEALDSWYIKLHLPPGYYNIPADRFIGYTMLEATRISDGWVKAINDTCERLFVPCEQNKEAFKDSGVNCDIAVIPLGIDPELFPERDYTTEDDEFIFGTMGTLTWRKGTDVLVRAFERAFPKKQYPKVQLYIKTLPAKEFNLTVAPYLNKEMLQDTDRYIINTSSMSPEMLVSDFFHKIDCFVFPTRGEGYGLPPVEAMCTGLPVIATNFSGCADYMDKEYSYPLDYDLVPVPYEPQTDRQGKIYNASWKGYSQDLYHPEQMWAEPSEDHLVELMREVYEDRKASKAKGKKAAKYVRKNLTMVNSANKIIDYLNVKF
jgi:glycosyltransferase involved in cell wall biosynthesis